MPRHHAALVHHQLSSYLKTGLIKSPPPSYSALLNYPPTPTPLRQSIKRDEFDLPTSLRSSSSSSKRRNSKSTHKFKKLIKTCKPLPIEYSELDQLRKAFFKDHPFEAYRPMNLIENPNELLYKTLKEPVRRIQSNGTLTNESDLVGVENWIELRQRTRVPRSEDCLDFAYALFKFHSTNYTLNSAYQISVSQFRTLRFENEISNWFGRQEAEFYGAKWSLDLLKNQLNLQDRWIKDQSGMDKVKSPQDLHGIRSSSMIKTSTSTHSLGGAGDHIIHPPIRKEAGFKAGESYLKEVLRKSRRLKDLQES